MRILRYIILFVLAPATLAARADTIDVFDFSGASIFYGVTMGGVKDLNTVSGMMTLDVTTGVVQSISFTAGGVFESGADSQSGPDVYVGVDHAKISFDAGSLINYNGAAFDLNGPNDLYVGGVVNEGPPQGQTNPPISTTPEPSSLLLLGTGLLAAVGVMRRQILPKAVRG